MNEPDTETQELVMITCYIFQYYSDRYAYQPNLRRPVRPRSSPGQSPSHSRPRSEGDYVTMTLQGDNWVGTIGPFSHSVEVKYSNSYFSQLNVLG